MQPAIVGGKALGYIRVSTEEQAISGAGLAAQREAIERECERRGWHLVELIEESGSAKNLKRPGIRKALARLEAGEAEVLLVAKLDRLSRSVADFAGLTQVAGRQGWAIVALDLNVDTSTPTGEAMANMTSVFSQLERRLIGQRTKEALAIKRAEGVRLGRPPTLPQKVRHRIRKMRERGMSYAAIADKLNAEDVPTSQGGARWWPATVRAVALRDSE